MKKIHFAEPEQSAIYQGEILATFSFDTKEDKENYIGNFEAMYLANINGTLRLYLWSDDNHGHFHEKNNLLILDYEL